MTKNCKNCGAELHGQYCSDCGQKIILPKDKRLRHLITEFFHHFTHLDGKFLKTLRKILWIPGKVTRDVSMGITAPYFKLSALFVVGTIIYFLLPSNIVVRTPANTAYESQLKNSEYGHLVTSFALSKSRSGNISQQALAARYNQRQRDYGKLLILLLIPMYIPVLWVISILVKKFNPANLFTAYDLGIASLEVNCIILYGFYLIAGICIWMATSIYGSEKVALAGLLIFLPAVLFLILSFFKRAYEIRWWQALICLTVLIIANIYIVNLLGLISFFIFI